MDDPIVQLTTPLRALSVSGGPRPGVIERVHPAPSAGAVASTSAAETAATAVARTPSPAEAPPAAEPALAPRALPPPWTAATPTETLVQPVGFVLPGSTGAARAWPLPWGFMWTPAAPLVEQSLTLHRTCVRCAHCNAAVNPFVAMELRVGTWTCAFCGGHNAHPEQFADPDPQSYPELGTKVVEYIEPDAQINWNALGVGLAPPPPVFIFVVDEVMAATNREVVVSSLQLVLQSLPSTAVVGFVSYSRSVSVYHLQSSDVAAAVVCSGTTRFESSVSKAQVLENLVSHLVALEYARDQLAKVLDAFTGFHRPPPRRGARSRAEPPKSALGAALDVAVALALAHYGGTAPQPVRRQELDSRIIVLAGAAPSIGPGAILAPGAAGEAVRQTDAVNREAAQFYEALGQQVAALGGSVFLGCLGHAQLGSRILACLTQPCGGKILSYPDPSDQVAADLLWFVHADRWLNVSLVVRQSAGASLRRVAGPHMDLLPSDGAKALPSWQLGALQPSRERGSVLQLPALSPHEALAVYLDLGTDDEAARAAEPSVSRPLPSTVYVQTEVHYTNRQNERVLRVVTFPLRTSTDLNTVLSALDGDVVAVMLARLAVLEAKAYSSGEVAVQFLDQQLYTLLRALGTPLAEPPFFQLPISLHDLPQRLYHLRRGPLLGTLLQHPDDILLAQSHFLASPLESSLRQMMPVLCELAWTGDADAVAILQLPLASLVLRSDRVLLFDDDVTLLLWMGRQVDPAVAAALQQRGVAVAAERAYYRFPRPTIRLLQEGSSMSRFLVCRLAPLHKEDRAAQEAQLPEIALLDKPAYARLMAQFHRTDELSFGDYCRRLRFGPAP